jgi:hypothetical protein
MKHLDDVEQRLEQAAQEVRRVAKHAVPPPPEGASRRSIAPGWLIFAVAFGVVILAIGLIPLISSPEDGEPAGTTAPVPTPTTVTPSTLPATTTPAGAPAGDCSAAGLPLPPEQEGLPPAVAEARLAIATAAIACDYEALERLAPPDFSTSFGDTGFEMIPQWEEDGTYPATALIVELFGTPYAYEDYEGQPRHYYWPSAFVYDSWEEIPPADMEALLSVYTQEELDQASEFGAYALWRIGITETGEWRFFIAGD